MVHLRSRPGYAQVSSRPNTASYAFFSGNKRNIKPPTSFAHRKAIAAAKAAAAAGEVTFLDQASPGRPPSTQPMGGYPSTQHMHADHGVYHQQAWDVSAYTPAHGAAVPGYAPHLPTTPGTAYTGQFYAGLPHSPIPVRSWGHGTGPSKPAGMGMVLNADSVDSARPNTAATAPVATVQQVETLREQCGVSRLDSTAASSLSPIVVRVVAQMLMARMASMEQSLLAAAASDARPCSVHGFTHTTRIVNASQRMTSGAVRSGSRGPQSPSKMSSTLMSKTGQSRRRGRRESDPAEKAAKEHGATLETATTQLGDVHKTLLDIGHLMARLDHVYVNRGAVAEKHFRAAQKIQVP